MYHENVDFRLSESIDFLSQRIPARITRRPMSHVSRASRRLRICSVPRIPPKFSTTILSLANFITAGVLDSIRDEVATVECTFARDAPDGGKEDGSGNEMSNGRAPRAHVHAAMQSKGHVQTGSRREPPPRLPIPGLRMVNPRGNGVTRGATERPRVSTMPGYGAKMN